MSGHQLGGFVDSDGAVAGRKSIPVLVANSKAMVGGGYEDFELGFGQDPYGASEAFANELFRVTNQLLDRPRNPNSPNFAEQIEQAMRFSDVESRTLLNRLRKLGYSLRQELSGDMAQELRNLGFVINSEDAPAALSFVEGANAPILWEMMYEGEFEGTADWRQFWGFATPIAHWLRKNRPPRVELQRGFYSAINTDLPFADQEVAMVAAHFGDSLPRVDLAGMFAEKVKGEQHQLLSMDDAQVNQWWEECKGRWLERFLEQKVAATPGTDAGEWVKDRLIDALRGCLDCDVIHFACHSTPHQVTPFLSNFEVAVGGLRFPLEPAHMTAAWKNAGASPKDRGSLVFLNACSTSAQDAAHKPPVFPSKWIEGQHAVAVIGTLCPVPDFFAHEFAVKFYEILFRGVRSLDDSEDARYRSIAEALLETRRHFMRPPYNNPLGLAYVLYAVKGAYVRAAFPAAAAHG